MYFTVLSGATVRSSCLMTRRITTTPPPTASVAAARWPWRQTPPRTKRYVSCSETTRMQSGSSRQTPPGWTASTTTAPHASSASTAPRWAPNAPTTCSGIQPHIVVAGPNAIGPTAPWSGALRGSTGCATANALRSLCAFATFHHKRACAH